MCQSIDIVFFLLHDGADDSDSDSEPAGHGKNCVYANGSYFMNGRHGAVGGMGVYWGSGDQR